MGPDLFHRLARQQKLSPLPLRPNSCRWSP